MENSESKAFFVVSSVAHFADSDVVGSVPPARLRHRLGLAFSPPASQAR